MTTEPLRELPIFGNRLASAMSFRNMTPADVQGQLRAFGLGLGEKYVYRLLSVNENRVDPRLSTVAGVRHALGVSAEWWFDPSLSAADLPHLRLE